MPRLSMHIEPSGATATARHYIRDIVYGANDGLITTFAVVGGVAGGSLSSAAVIVIGAANLAADGVSMGAGNLLSIRADERAREASELPELEAYPWKHGIATTLAFVVAGAIPLLPYVLPAVEHRLLWSSALTFIALFVLGASARHGGSLVAIGHRDARAWRSRRVGRVWCRQDRRVDRGDPALASTDLVILRRAAGLDDDAVVDGADARRTRGG